MINKRKKDILDDLFHRRRFNIKPGLERTLELAAYFNNPQAKFRSIHLAGTNGKGTTASLIAASIKEAGYKVGLYTSPHIFDFNERIVIDGRQIEDDELIELAKPILEKADEIGATFFEITTILAFQHFANQNVDLVVVECGMGGRFDSTNIIAPEIACITAIAMDHSEYLGNDIKAIVKEKTGIIKGNTPAVVSFNTPTVIEEIKQILQNSNIEYLNDTIEIKDYKFDKDNITATVDILDENSTLSFNLPYIGYHQAKNLATAFSVFKKFAEIENLDTKEAINIFKTTCDNGYKSFALQGRMQIINKSPLVIADGGHNPDAARMLAKSMEIFDEKFNIVFSAMADKDIEEILFHLKTVANKFIFPQLKYERAESNNNIAQVADKLGISDYQLSPSTEEAIKTANTLGKNYIISGSFFLLSELAYLEKSSIFEN